MHSSWHHHSLTEHQIDNTKQSHQLHVNNYMNKQTAGNPDGCQNVETVYDASKRKDTSQAECFIVFQRKCQNLTPPKKQNSKSDWDKLWHKSVKGPLMINVTQIHGKWAKSKKVIIHVHISHNSINRRKSISVECVCQVWSQHSFGMAPITFIVTIVQPNIPFIDVLIFSNMFNGFRICNNLILQMIFITIIVT